MEKFISSNFECYEFYDDRNLIRIECQNIWLEFTVSDVYDYNIFIYNDCCDNYWSDHLHSPYAPFPYEETILTLFNEMAKRNLIKPHNYKKISPRHFERSSRRYYDYLTGEIHQEPNQVAVKYTKNRNYVF